MRVVIPSKICISQKLCWLILSINFILDNDGMIAILHNDIYAPSFGISSSSNGKFYRYLAINYIILRKPKIARNAF